MVLVAERDGIFAGKNNIPDQDNVAAVDQSLEMDHSQAPVVLLVQIQVRILGHHTHILDLQLVQLDQIRSQTSELVVQQGHT